MLGGLGSVPGNGHPYPISALASSIDMFPSVVGIDDQKVFMRFAVVHYQSNIILNRPIFVDSGNSDYGFGFDDSFNCIGRPTNRFRSFFDLTFTLPQVRFGNTKYSNSIPDPQSVRIRHGKWKSNFVVSFNE